MTTFVLVHGGGHGGWCWKRVAARLRHAGHEVFTPTLTGLGERAHLLHEGIDLNTHIQDIVGVLQWEELADVVLCGHSYGGMVITGVADKAPAQLRALVYLDAFLPADGQSLMDLVFPERVASFRDYARTKGAGFRVAPIPAEVLAVNRQDRPGLIGSVLTTRSGVWSRSCPSRGRGERCRSGCTCMRRGGLRVHSPNSMSGCGTIRPGRR
jgi:pimeloyl-ACP methyl ester carboxylesterase